MDNNKEVLEKLENIEFLLASSIENTNKVVREASDPGKRQKEAEILNQAYINISSISSQIAGLITKEKALIEGFSPKVEVNHYNVDYKKPAAWIWTAIIIMFISIVVSYYFIDKNEKTSKERDYYKKESDSKDWNYMKYKYLELYGDERMVSELQSFDTKYNKDYQTYDRKVMQREKQLREAAEKTELARQRSAEAKKLQQQADSLRR